MKLFLILVAMTILVSCNENKYKKEFFPEGSLKSKIEINDNGIPNGVYEEYYPTGELKMKTKYLNGILIDSVYVYHTNGKISEKGKMLNGHKVNWWSYFYSNGNLKNKNEYIIRNDSTLLMNQNINYKENGEIDYEISSFFNIELADTLVLGKNTGKVNYYSNSKAQEKFLYAIIDNSYSDNETKRDTFIEEPDFTHFGVFTHKLGLKKIKGILTEQLINVKEINSDSSQLIIKENKKYFERDVFVIKKRESK